MTAYDLLGFFLVMSALAAIPSASVALVVVRSATVNVRNGIATAVGVVVGVPDLYYHGHDGAGGAV